MKRFDHRPAAVNFGYINNLGEVVNIPCENLAAPSGFEAWIWRYDEEVQLHVKMHHDRGYFTRSLDPIDASHDNLKIFIEDAAAALRTRINSK